MRNGRLKEFKKEFQVEQKEEKREAKRKAVRAWTDDFYCRKNRFVQSIKYVADSVLSMRGVGRVKEKKTKKIKPI